MEEDILVEATIGAEASDVEETATLGMIYDPISK